MPCHEQEVPSASVVQLQETVAVSRRHVQGHASGQNHSLSAGFPSGHGTLVVPERLHHAVTESVIAAALMADNLAIVDFDIVSFPVPFFFSYGTTTLKGPCEIKGHYVLPYPCTRGLLFGVLRRALL
jgi:hypothetical protein